MPALTVGRSYPTGYALRSLGRPVLLCRMAGMDSGAHQLFLRRSQFLEDKAVLHSRVAAEHAILLLRRQLVVINDRLFARRNVLPYFADRFLLRVAIGQSGKSGG